MALCPTVYPVSRDIGDPGIHRGGVQMKGVIVFANSYHLISDKVVAQIVGDIAESHIHAIDAFCEKNGADKEHFVYASLDWGKDGSYDEYDDEDFKALETQRDEIISKFKKATGMELRLVYCEGEDRGDIDGYAWYIDFISLFQRTPNYEKFIATYGEDADWESHIINYDD